MITKGIRGAITAEENSIESIKDATLELLTEIFKQNKIQKSDISHVIFTITKDLDKVFPAKFARLDFGFDNVAMMCFNEADIDGAIQKCIRILIVVNCDESFEPQFVYLKGAKNLRK
jgi:chorismate mutase